MQIGYDFFSPKPFLKIGCTGKRAICLKYLAFLLIQSETGIIVRLLIIVFV